MAWARGINWPYCYSFSIPSSQQHCTLYFKGVFFFFCSTYWSSRKNTLCVCIYIYLYPIQYNFYQLLYSWSYIVTGFNNLIDLGCDMWCNVPKLGLKIVVVEYFEWCISECRSGKFLIIIFAFILFKWVFTINIEWYMHLFVCIFGVWNIC